MMKDDCLFCKIVRKEVPANILYEDDDILVMMDAYPTTDGHSLVIPKKHFEDIYEIPEDYLMKLFSIGKTKAKDIMQKLNKESLSFLINYGSDQAIKHIHLHLLPNFIKMEKNMDKDEVFKILTED